MNALDSPAVRRVPPAVWIIGAACTLARSVYLGVDANWDLLYYHLYKSRALFDGSLSGDVAVAGLGTFLNPLIEVPTAIGLALFGTRWGLLVSAAVVQFLCYVAVWRLVDEIGRRLALGVRSSFSIVLFALCVTGSAAVSLSFTTFGDWLAAGLLCEAVRAVFRSVDQNAARPHQLVMAGAWFGLALGLKLTVMPFAFGLAAAVIVSHGYRPLLRLAGGAALAFVLSAGPWMVYLKVRYGSPVFPFYNGVFNAPSASDRNFDDARFGATNIGSIAEFPAELMRGTARYSEFVMQDWRFVGLAAVATLAVVVDPRSTLKDPVVRVLAAMLVPSFVVWIVTFGIYRYFVFGEILASALFGVLVLRLIHEPTRAAAVCLGSLVFGTAFQIAPNWGRDAELTTESLRRVSASIESEMPVILLDAGPPASYMLNEFPSSARFVGTWALRTELILYQGEIKQEVDDLVDEALGQRSLYAVVDPLGDPSNVIGRRLVLSDCLPFVVTGREFELCHVESTDREPSGG